MKYQTKHKIWKEIVRFIAFSLLVLPFILIGLWFLGWNTKEFLGISFIIIAWNNNALINTKFKELDENEKNEENSADS